MTLKFLKKTMFTLLFGCVAIGSASATSIPFDISIVADNDFAIFSGNSTSINHLVYQNNEDWVNQIARLSSLNFTLASGDDKFYVLAMGGGGEENISGLFNGVNITALDVLMSSNIAPNFSGYNPSDIQSGKYDAILSDVQAAFSTATWSAPSINSTQTVIEHSGFDSGFTFSTLNAHLFSFDAVDANIEVSPVPEPTTLAIFALG
ncbi:MAG: hypothetical protein GY787_01765, partial [Alteromonadales bacterium]|nr:hypothetical protein [Alteromonadales bacterium]